MPPSDKPTNPPPERGILDGPADFVHAAAHTFIQTPIDGVTQIFNKTTSQNLHPLELISAPKENNNWTFAGDTVATVGQFFLAQKGLRSGLSGMGVVSATDPTRLWETVAAGTAVDILHPVDPNEKNFLWAKTRNAAISAGTFAAMGGTSKLLADGDMVTRVGRRGLAESISMHAFSGAVGGMTNAELEALGHGKAAPDLDTFLNRTKQFAAFGAVFGAVDATLNRANVNFAKADNEIGRRSAPSTEDYIRNNVNDASPLRSPMLTWLAENRPNLRPPNYEAYKADILTKPTVDRPHLGLNDWPVEQRPQVLAEIRNIASKTQLSSDANIDAFISRLDIPEFREYSSPARVEARNEAYSDWSKASEKFQKYVEADPVLNEMTTAKIVTSTELQQSHPALGPMINEISAAEKAYTDLVQRHVAETKIEPAMNKTLNALADEAGLPDLGSVKVTGADPADGTYMSNGRVLSVNDRILRTGLSPETAETAYHEFVHHDYRLGYLRTLFGRGPKLGGNPVGTQIRIDAELQKLNEPGATLNLLERLGDTDSMTRRMLSPLPKSVEYYAEQAKAGKINTSAWHETDINNELSKMLVDRLINARKVAWHMHTSYVGTPIELPAWSTGFLTNIRSRALGLPQVDMPPASVPLSIAEILKKTSK
ncbi:MAG: hypothetical protein HYX67_07150 [Candidatus Melainabacteria bacterium]|nr:hypothetical protein [Candidatus Melainabacteria bacterium]